jgi:hypothetical protein
MAAVPKRSRPPRAKRPSPRDTGTLPVLGDEHELTKVEAWLEGLTILDASEFLDADGQRWRQITLSNGHVLQILLTHPWLIIEPQ